MAPDPYAVLGVAATATDSEVREAYLRRSKQLHPDRLVGATDAERDAATRAMQDLTAAYQALRDRRPVSASSPAAPTSAARPAPPAPPRRRTRWGLIVVAVMVASTVAALLTSDASPPPPDPQRDDDLSALEGKCITLRSGGQFEDIVDCTRPHDARVVKVVAHATACPLWSDARLTGTTQDLCLDTV